MRVGGERRLRVAPHLAYRDQGIPGVVPVRAVLEFHVTLLRVDGDTADDEPRKERTRKPRRA
jgi:hypothetical protein